MQTDEEKITLDMKAFQTLASDTRISILKSLDQRRKTLTELSHGFGLSASTVKEHMDKLTTAGLVRLVDDGHKWKYYELTRSGSNILHPGTTKIWVMLGIAAVGAFYAAWNLLKPLPSTVMGAARDGVLTAGKGVNEAVQTTVITAPEAGVCVPPATAAPAIPLPDVAMLFIFSMLLGVAVVALISAKKTSRL